MTRYTIAAAAVAAAISFTAPAQAHMANPALANPNVSTPQATVQLAQYWRHRHHRSWRRHYAWHPRRHRHCWSVRVRTWGHHYTWVRRCGWR